MSSPVDTTGRSPTEVWETSPEYIRGRVRYSEYVGWMKYGYSAIVAWEDTPWYRDARHAYRKRINRSWDKEST